MLYNQTNNTIGVLFEVITVENLYFFFQNFYPANDFLFLGNYYQFVGLNYNPPERNITLSNEQTSVVIPALPVVIDILESNNYLINAVAQCYVINQDFPNNPPIAQDRAVISSYSIQDSSGKDATGSVTLNISAPFNSVNGTFPNVTYNTGKADPATVKILGYIPAIPISNNNQYT